MTENGGVNGGGTCWEWAAGTGAITTIKSFSEVGQSYDPDDSSFAEYVPGLSGLTIDSNGNLYGTTTFELSPNFWNAPIPAGTVWKLTPSTGTFSELADFDPSPFVYGASPYPQGNQPKGTLALDAAGDLFGTAEYGGDYTTGTPATNLGNGSVWELPTATSTPGALTTLATFSGDAGENPTTGVIADAAGDLFGTTSTGGSSGGGVSANGALWELPAGSSTILPLYSFADTNAGPFTTGIIANSSTQPTELFSGEIVAGEDGGGTTPAVAELSAASPGFSSAAPNAGTLLPSVTATNLTGSVVDTVRLRDYAVVSIANQSATPYRGPATVELYASRSTTVTANATLLASVTRGLVIRGNGSSQLVIPITSLPAALDGSYHLVAAVKDSGGQAAQLVSTNGLTAVPATDGLKPAVSGNWVQVVGQSPTTMPVDLQLSEAGNVPAVGMVHVALQITQSLTDAPVGEPSVFAVPVVLRQGKSREVVLPLKLATALPEGSYFLSASVTDPLGAETTATGGNLQVETPQVLLSPAVLASPSANSLAHPDAPAVVWLNIYNAGNVTSSGITTITVYAKPISSPADTEGGASALKTENLKLTILPEHSVRVEVRLANLSQLTAGQYEFGGGVIDPLGGTSTGFALTPVTVA